MDFNKELMERIWKHIDKNENGCWLSDLYRHKHGYTKLRIKEKMVLFHRLVLLWSDQTKVEDFNNPKRMACHNCPNKNTHCVNPKHLYWGNQSDNMKDRVKDGNHNWKNY